MNTEKREKIKKPIPAIRNVILTAFAFIYTSIPRKWLSVKAFEYSMAHPIRFPISANSKKDDLPRELSVSFFPLKNSRNG